MLMWVLLQGMEESPFMFTQRLIFSPLPAYKSKNHVHPK